jgi:signal transduction histidine kinase
MEMRGTAGSSIAHALRGPRSTGRDEQLEEIVRAAAAALGAPIASLALLDERGAAHLHKTIGASPGSEAALAAHAEALLGWELVGRELADLRGRPEPELAALVRAGVRALCSVPVFVDAGRCVGALSAYFTAPRSVSGECKRLRVYADLAATALERAGAKPSPRLADTQLTTMLYVITAAFAKAVTREEMVHVLLELGVTAVDASGGAVFFVSEEAAALELAASHAPGLEGPHLPGSIPLASLCSTEGNGSELEAFWIEAPQELALQSAELAAVLGPLHYPSFAFLPLSVEGRPFGAVLFGFEAPRRFSDADRAFLLALARQCAQALERAWLYEVERKARSEAEKAGQRLRLLADASVILSSSLDWESAVASAARVALGHIADWCAVDVCQESEILRVALLHADPAQADTVAALLQHGSQEHSRNRIRQVVESGTSVLIHSTPELLQEVAQEDPRRLELLEKLGKASFVIAPLVGRGPVYGTLSFVRGPARSPFTEDDRLFCEALAHRAGLAIENARLFDALRRSQAQTSASAERLQLLADAAQVLESPNTDLESVLQTLVELAASTLADACGILLLSQDGQWLTPIALHHRDPHALAAIRAALPSRLSAAGGFSGQVLRTGEPLLYPVIDPAQLAAATPSPEAELLDPRLFHSFLIVPLAVKARVIGTLSLGRTRVGAPFTQDDRLTFQTLADRSATSIEKARLYRRALEAVRARSDFLAVAGHELKTPLTALKLQVQGLARLAQEELSPRVAERATKAARAVTHLARLIDELLDVSRLSAGRLELRRDRFDLTALLRELLERSEEELDRAGCAARLFADGPVWGYWDRPKVEQIAVNLLGNAIKYGQGKPIEVRVAAAAEMAHLSVRDEGIGIAPEDQARIFNRFERLSRSGYGGLGLGLWIARQIAEAHGGTIRVQSELGRGSMFEVNLPRGMGEE